MSDLISRSALKKYVNDHSTHWLNEWDTAGVLLAIENAPAVDAVVLPKGRPGDYLEWKTGGIGYIVILPIEAILICEDCVRYDLGGFEPIVDHKNIVRIMTREEAKREIERRVCDGR